VHYPVTREHYEKYCNLAASSRVRFNVSSYRSCGFQTLAELAAYQKRDARLADLSPALFSAWSASIRMFNPFLRSRPEYELVCLAKHCLLAHTLEARPRFIEKKEARL